MDYVMTKLMPFQKQGVRLIEEFGGRVLLADEQGLGKTLEALTWLKKAQKWPVVVVCPACVKLHWEREALNHVGMKATLLYGQKPKGRKLLRGKSLYVINYDILSGWVGFLKSLNLKVVVGDEIHYISSLKAQRTKAFQKLCDGVQHILALSGTPLTNRPFELWPVLSILWPEKFKSPFAFGHTFCNAVKEFGHWRFEGAQRLRKLHKILTGCGMIRRTKEQVLLDLPPKRNIVVPVDIEDRKDYDAAEADFIGWLAEEEGLAEAQRASYAERYTKFGYLKRMAARLKMKHVLAWIESYLTESDGKLFVGAIHKSIIKQMKEKFGCLVIDGSKNQKQRDEAEQKFRKEPNCRMLVGQIQAAGVGINLPEANTVLFAELPWHPAACQQFSDRAHRLTTKHQVDVYWIIAHGTIEEKLCSIIQNKNGVLDRVLDGVTSRVNTLTVMDELHRQLRSRHEPLHDSDG